MSIFFPYGSHLLHNAFNQFRPFASSSSQAIPYPADFFLFPFNLSCRLRQTSEGMGLYLFNCLANSFHTITTSVHFFPYGSHLLHNALNQFRPFASSSSQAVPYGRRTITRHKGKEAKRNGSKPERCSSCVLPCPPPALRNLCGAMFKAQYKTDDTRHKNKKKKEEQQREQQ